MSTDSTSRCWWCGAEADSREHKIKQTDLRRIQGTDQFIYWGTGNGPLKALPNSKVREVKFPKSLCKQCNNVRSRRLDAAYDTFSAYTWENARDLRYRTYLDFNRIFSSNSRKKSRQVLRYLTKHIGCRIHEVGFTVPKELPEYLNGASHMPHVAIAFYKDVGAYRAWSIRRANGLDTRGAYLGSLAVQRADNRPDSPAEAFAGEMLIGTIGILFSWDISSNISADDYPGDKVALYRRTDLPLVELRTDWPTELARMDTGKTEGTQEP